MFLLSFTDNMICPTMKFQREEVLLGILGGGRCAAWFSKSWSDFRPKNVIFHTPFQTRPSKIRTCFQTWPLGRIMLSLLRLERKQNPFRIRTLLFRSYSSIIWNWNDTDTFIHSRSSLKNHTRFQTKMGKSEYPFSDQTGKNPSRWGGTYLYSWYKGVPPR